MAAPQIDRIIAGCTIGGVVAALALVVGPVAGAPEHLITGTILLMFAVCWALVALLSTAWTDQPQRWAVALASFMGVAGVALVVFAPNDTVYDRSGRGWSDPVSVAQGGGAVAEDLHTLLTRANVPGPFVTSGHSSGAQYVRIFAGRYPEQVAGMVLLDGQPADAFESLPSYATFYRVFHRIFAVLPTLARLGVGRVVVHPYGELPAPAREMQRVHYASAGFYRSLRDEFEELPASLAQAGSFQSLGNRPLVVVTAAQDPQAGWLPLQAMLARLSTNSSHRVVPATHISLVTDQTAAQMSIEAIRDVVHAVRYDAALD